LRFNPWSEAAEFPEVVAEAPVGASLGVPEGCPWANPGRLSAPGKKGSGRGWQSRERGEKGVSPPCHSVRKPI
jgi:hypothetical protein